MGTPNSNPAAGINGDASALAVDRAIGELRRGRALHLSDGLVIAAVEAASGTLLARLRSAGAPLRLLLTAERAGALGIVGDGGPVVLSVPPDATIDTLRAIAGAGPGDPEIDDLDDNGPAVALTPLAEAGFKLAKAGRLLPALLALEVPETPDPSLLSIPAAAIAARSAPKRHSLKRISQSRVPLADALDCELVLFRDEHSLGEHLAVLIGEAPRSERVVPVRLHSACLTGDLLGSLRCDCGEQLRNAVRRIHELGGGVLLYLDQEGRGIGLANKLRAYALQDDGLDTLDADRRLGFLDDERSYDVAAAMLLELGITRIKLLTNNPRKIAALRAHEIDVVGRVPLTGTVNSHNARYLKAKRERAGHLE